MLNKTDSRIFKLVKEEEKRLKETLQMIPSENYPSKSVLEALGSVFNFKYSEGYPLRRYYQGNEFADKVEIIAEERAKKLFDVPYANVQPYSGSPANSAIYFALLTPGKDKIIGLSLAFGGHLTHGSPVSFSGKYFKIIPYHLNDKEEIDYKEVEELALREKPKIIVCGATAYPKIINFKKFGEIADKVGAYLLSDISHIAGLVAAGAHPSPAPYVHLMMTTTHKTLRGPRGAMIMITRKGLKKDPDLASKIDKAVFPGLQGGPHDNQTAAIAVALNEASKTSFKKYGHQVVKNSKVLGEELKNYGFKLIGGGSENHLILADLSSKNVNGAVAAHALELAGIICNKNAVPNDTNPPFYPSGIRLGTPAITTRGMKEKEMKQIAKWINEVVEECPTTKIPEQKEDRAAFWANYKRTIAKNNRIKEIKKEVKKLCSKFPLP